MPDSELLTTKQACELLNCSRAWLNKHRAMCDVHPYKAPGRTGLLLYTMEDLHVLAESMGRQL